MENDVMVDIETLGTGPDAYILSIGACTMDGEKTFYEVIGPGQLRKIDLDTVVWWTKQSMEARTVLEQAAKSSTTLQSALISLYDWLHQVGFDKSCGIWSHGATFDLVILDDAYYQLGLTTPWKYWQCRDTRTVIDMHEILVGKKEKPIREGVHHNALDDALYQSRWMMSLVKDIYKAGKEV